MTMVPDVKRIIRGLQRSLGGLFEQPSPSRFASGEAASLASASALKHRRFLSDNPILYDSAIRAAETYVSKLSKDEVDWLWSKPFERNQGNTQYFRLMYDLLNILKAMDLPAKARILEIGSGPGWVTEILLMLDYSVDALEPAADLTEIARQRCAALTAHYRNEVNGKLNFHNSTLEEIEFEQGTFDAVLCFDVWHHVVDENIGIEKIFRFLKPGGCLGIVDGAWHPEFKEFERELKEAMDKFGTLENPFSIEYMDLLLNKTGFVEIERYAAVNGFFPASQLSQPLKSFTLQPIHGSNNITARKPEDITAGPPNCANPRFKTEARITLKSRAADQGDGRLHLTVQIENRGETVLYNRPARPGHVTVALRCGEPGSANFKEALERLPLAETLQPGRSVKMDLAFTIPATGAGEKWELDLVCEGAYWFSSKGMKSCSVA